ncbi:MAG: SCO family protein [Erythrobacter tepidarius]
MNRNNKPSPGILAALAATFLLLAACQPAAPKAQAPLSGAAIGGDFALVNSKEEIVRWDDFAGKYRIVYFGYTFCPDICPTDMQRVAQGLKLLKARDSGKAAKIVPIFITIDPERDTPKVVGEFAAAFSPDIIALTGTPEQIAAVAKAFRVFYAKGEAVAGGGYLVDHSNIAYLFGPEGEPIATLPVDQGAEAVAAEIAKWVN